jgi:hypothetical protein
MHGAHVASLDMVLCRDIEAARYVGQRRRADGERLLRFRC